MLKKSLSLFEEYLIVDGKFRYFRLYQICLPVFIPTTLLLYALLTGFFKSLENSTFENLIYLFQALFGLFGALSLYLIVVLGVVQVKHISRVSS
jgi:hypothetical protein